MRAGPGSGRPCSWTDGPRRSFRRSVSGCTGVSSRIATVLGGSSPVLSDGCRTKDVWPVPYGCFCVFASPCSVEDLSPWEVLAIGKMLSTASSSTLGGCCIFPCISWLKLKPPGLTRWISLAHEHIGCTGEEVARTKHIPKQSCWPP